MGAVEHLKTLCCLGLPPESAMIAVTPLLHEIIPHGTMRVGLVAPDATITAAYDEHPAADALYRERFWRFMDDPSASGFSVGACVPRRGHRLVLAPAGRRLPGQLVLPGICGAA